MTTIGISEFKQHALKILNEISKKKETIIITKRGKPLAEIKAYENKNELEPPGQLSEFLVFEDDIIS